MCVLGCRGVVPTFVPVRNAIQSSSYVGAFSTYLPLSSQIRNDRGCHKEICGLEVDCPTRPTPCDWRGQLVKIEVLNATIADALMIAVVGVANQNAACNPLYILAK